MTFLCAKGFFFKLLFAFDIALLDQLFFMCERHRPLVYYTFSKISKYDVYSGPYLKVEKIGPHYNGCTP